MTDKPVIVDGVDVSGCDFLAKEDDYCSCSGEYRAYKGQCGCSDEEMCKDHPNCFYKKALKQLQRKEKKCEVEDVYPLTIVKDRYDGCYSGGTYTAWNKDPQEIPKAIDLGDTECCKFWSANEEIVGIGSTPDLAAEDLANKLREGC